MKRVAFFMQANQSAWLGGLSYIRNLLNAIYACDDRRIEPVLLVHPALEQSSLNGFPEIEVIRAPWVAPRHPARLASRALYDFLDRDLTLELLLRKHRIDALSHSTVTGARSTVASIGWIPDFQHVRMPQYFTATERQRRDRQFRRLIDGSRRIILSSFDARRDFASFAPDALARTNVLHFVSCPESFDHPLSQEQLHAQLGIDRPYFHLPNQFWTHKNHALVIEALRILKKRHINTLVLATGNTRDHRDPLHFDRLMQQARDLGVDANFRVLGIVARPVLQSLMLNAVALINPSSFEGWSTTVEESKSLGLPIILSDIPVHLEQSPPLGRFFTADSAEALAAAIYEASRDYDPTQEVKNRTRAASELPTRLQNFADCYQEIVCMGTL